MDTLSSLTTFDIVVLFIIGLSTLMAFFKGFVAAVLSFTNWVISSVVVAYVSPSLADALSGVVSSPRGAQLLSMAIVFIASFIVIMIINSQIISLFKKSGLGFLDRTLGIAFGMVRGILIVVVIFLSITISYALLAGEQKQEAPEWLSNAKSYNVLKLISTFVMDYVPDSTLAEAQEKIKGIATDGTELGKTLLTGESPQGSKNALLAPQASALMDKVMSSLPEAEVDELAAQYGSDLGKMSNQQKLDFYMKIFHMYEDGASLGVVDKSKRLNQAEYNQLYNALHQADVEQKEQKEDNTGYRTKQLDEMNRLIDSVK